MEAENQSQQTPPNVEAEPSKLDARDREAPLSFLAEVIKAAMDKQEKEGCACNRPDCAARSIHKFDTELAEELKPHWKVIKNAIEEKYLSALEEIKKLQKLAGDQNNQLRRELCEKNSLQSQLEQAQQANLKLIKSIGRLAKK